MNENNTAVGQAKEKNQIELNLMDLLAELLLQWKKILLFLLIGAVLGCVGPQLNFGDKKKLATEDKIARARELVATDRAAMVDQLFLQYISYKELQEDMRAYYSSYAAGNMNMDNTVQMRSEYYIVSTVKDLDTVFIKMAVTEADYQAMRAVAPDEEAGAPIYDRIVFTTAYNEKTSDSINNNTINNTIKTPVEEGKENAYLINVELYGNSEEQCRDMMAVVEAAFRRETEELKVLDPEIRLESLGEQFDYNVADFIQTVRKKNIDRMTVSDNELRNLTTNSIEKLSAEETDYFNLLMQRYNAQFAAKKHVSWLKWTVIGAFLGAFFTACVLVFKYLLDGKVHSAYELEQSADLLNSVFVKGKKNLFGKWAAALIHVDETDPAVKADMVATDINILMEKIGKNRLVLLCSREEENAAGFADLVKTQLLAKNSGLSVSIGNPLCSAEELRLVAQADIGIAFAEMKKSKREMLRGWMQICRRYRLPLEGAIAVQRCW